MTYLAIPLCAALNITLPNIDTIAQTMPPILQGRRKMTGAALLGLEHFQ